MGRQPMGTTSGLGTIRPEVGIIGCGRMGSALAAMFAADGFTTRLASRHSQTSARLADCLPRASAGTLEYAAKSDLVVLAAPFDTICEHIGPHIRPLLGDHVVIDVSNPGFGSGRPIPAPSGAPSAAERIAAALATDRLVKALNCVAARSLACRRAGTTVTVPIAGDDLEAKRLVRSVLEVLRFEVTDTGPLRNSRWLEGLSHVLACLGSAGGTTERIDFRLVTPAEKREDNQWTPVWPQSRPRR
jgi:8-hydroxy-5-deazaflavin:NADPH oxidoreductase